MADWSDSDQDDFVPAVLQRPKVANYVVHESFTVDTRDHEDHTFCGVMFDVQCKGKDDGGLPVEFLQIDSISIRGDLGPITVWSTPTSRRSTEHSEEEWSCLYEKEHTPSRQHYQKLELTQPIRLAPGESCGLYVHSKLPGDDAIVYDNQRERVTYEDKVFRVLPGMAHLSNRPFGRHGMWGFPWRQQREFVGNISYGVGYVLWNPVREVHIWFPEEFRAAARLLLLCARRQTSPMHSLQDEVVYYILNMCRHDWFSTEQSRQSNARAAGQGAADACYAPPLRRPRLAWGSISSRAVWPAVVQPDSEEEESSDLDVHLSDYDAHSD
jgi:hypothetical protein